MTIKKLTVDMFYIYYCNKIKNLTTLLPIVSFSKDLFIRLKSKGHI